MYRYVPEQMRRQAEQIQYAALAERSGEVLYPRVIAYTCFFLAYTCVIYIYIYIDFLIFSLFMELKGSVYCIPLLDLTPLCALL